MESEYYLTISEGDRQPLKATRGMPAAVHVFDRDSIIAVNAALAARRPLLVRGEPGCGKSQLARAVASLMNWAFVSHTVDAQTEPRDLFWTMDTVARLADAQLVGHQAQLDGNDDKDGKNVGDLLDERRYVRPGPLWWAFNGSSAIALEEDLKIQMAKPDHPLGDWSNEETKTRCVVLLDEIDKADPSVPNGLLEALGSGHFDAPGTKDGVVMDPDYPPLVIITTNEERVLPDAFLRRCLVLRIELPDDLVPFLVDRGQAHFQSCQKSVLQRAAELVASERTAVRKRGLNPPGQAEFIDLVRVVFEQRKNAPQRLELLEEVAAFTLDKHARDESLS